jgi:isopropylmalate/homocitrate/citramalate synthase
VPAAQFGRRQVIEISHMSGMSNVKYWLAEHGYDTSDEDLCQRVFELAKNSGHTLTAEEIHACCRTSPIPDREG